MRPETIKGHIDKNITALLENMNYEEVRRNISDISTRFSSRIPEIDVSSLATIDDVSDARSRYTAYYVFFTNRRIVDITNIQQKNSRISRVLNFKTLLFKERLLSCTRPQNTINLKYKNLI